MDDMRTAYVIVGLELTNVVQYAFMGMLMALGSGVFFGFAAASQIEWVIGWIPPALLGVVMLAFAWSSYRYLRSIPTRIRAESSVLPLEGRVP